MPHRTVGDDALRVPQPDLASVEQDDVVSALLECLPHAVLLLDRDATIVGVNDAALALIGDARDALLGRPVACVLPSLSGDALSVPPKQPGRPPVPQPGEWSLRTRSGTSIAVRLTLSELVLQRQHRVVATITGARPQPMDQEVMREAEARVRELVDWLPMLIWTASPDGTCGMLNRRWLEYTGIPEHEQLGVGWLRQVHPDDVEVLAAAGARAIATGMDYRSEFRLRRADGAYRWFQTHGVALRDKHGAIVKWVGANTEIHEARELRERLRAEQDRLATIIENSPGVMVSFERTAEGVVGVTFVSGSASSVFGFSPQEIEAEPGLLFSHVHPDDRGLVLAKLDESAQQRVQFHCEVRYDHPADGERWLESRSSPRAFEDGRIVWSGLVTDVTARKLADDELRMTRAQLESALAAGEMGAWMWDSETELLWGSAGQRRIWGLSDDTPTWFPQTVIDDRLHPDDVQRVQTASLEALQKGQRLELEFRMIVPGRGERWIASRAHVEQRAPGGPFRFSGINLDITQQKLANELALRSQKLEALGTLAGGIAHDFNNVLFAIAGNASLALALLPPDSVVRELVGEIASASSRATELVRQILAFSRPQDQKREVLALAVPVQEALRLVRATTPRTIDIEAELDPETPAVLVDAARVVQVVVNLCTNAAHAIGKDRPGSIQVRLDPIELVEPTGDVPAGRYAMLSVRDDGCGIEESLQTRIFDPFFTTKAPGEGTGLGLSVVHGIVQAFGGHLTLWSQPGQGALFRIYFPAVHDPRRVSTPSVDSLPSGGGKRLLFVDDESPLVALGERFLEVLGYIPAAFQDPHAALEAFRREPHAFAAVVTDMSMPAMSGFELVRSLRAIRPDLPVLMMSGYVGPEERRNAAELGIAELVLKPLDLDQLGELLARLC